jgi:superfamily I DNA/RNA helicase
MARHDVVIDSLYKTISDAGITVVNSGDSSLPDLLVVDKKYGFGAIFVLMENEFTDQDDLKSYVKSRMKNLRNELSGLLESDFRPEFIVYRSQSKKEKGYYEGLNLDFLEGLNAKVIDEELRNLIYERFNPKFSFIKKRRLSLDDPARENREKLRIILRDEQREFVDLPPQEVLWITGPAGSGKSLVLMARARKYAQLFPEYAISFITFNQSLKRYFEDELKEYPNILVESFGEFTRRRGDKFQFYYKRNGEKQSVSENQTQIEYRNAKFNGIVRDVDAIFIDEVQDFFPSWIRYCIETQRLDRGGATVAGDLTQAIYRENDIAEAITSYDFRKVELPVSYRSTQEILLVTEHLTGIKHKLEMSPHGPKPDLIRVNPIAKKNALNEALISDVIEILRHKGVRERDIGILVTKNYQRYAIRQELETRLQEAFHFDVQVASIERGAADSLNLEEDSIKLTTVHNAKGLEFSIVFLVGLDEIWDREDDDEESIKRAESLMLVGPTRAKDRLFIYFKKDNVYFDRLSKHPESVTFRVYPEDFAEGVK